MPRVAGSCTRGVDRAAPPGAGPAAASMTALPLAWPVLGSRPSLCTIDDKGASWCAAQKLGCDRDFVQVRCESTCKQSLQQTHLRKLPPCEALNTSDASTWAAAGLDDFAGKHGTDKLKHGFSSVYEKRYGPQRHRLRRLLEIGVFFGASLRMWRDYFPTAQIVGLDTFRGVQGVSHRSGARVTFGKADLFLRQWEAGQVGERIQLVVANQSSVTDMERALALLRPYAPFDVIIEDGSHLQADQQRNLAQLFELVRPGGDYVIEDIHSSLQMGYDEPPRSKHTTLAMVNRFNSSRTLSSKYMSAAQRQRIAPWIQSVETLRGATRYDLTCIVSKRLNPPT